MQLQLHILTSITAPSEPTPKYPTLQTINYNSFEYILQFGAHQEDPSSATPNGNCELIWGRKEMVPTRQSPCKINWYCTLPSFLFRVQCQIHFLFFFSSFGTCFGEQWNHKDCFPAKISIIDLWSSVTV